MTQTSPQTYQGTDKLLFGIILGVLAFWLFAQTTLNISPQMAADLGIEQNLMNIAVSITALFSGIFIVVIGGISDRIGRVKVVQWGFWLSIVGSLAVGLAPAGALGTSFLMFGRIFQGLSAAFIMSASLALVKAYWAEGKPRQRAISLWSMGSWGGSGFAALFGGLMASNVGWRYIFIISAVLSLIGWLMVRGTPESKAESKGGFKFDLLGIGTFLVTMIALQIVATQGSKIGWTSPITLGLAAIAAVFFVIFFKVEAGNKNAFINFKLFDNRIYTGATISNFMLNGIAGMIIVSMLLLQLGGQMTAQAAGMLTLGYAITIVLFIRVGEKLLQKFGSRKPMIWGCLISGLSIAMLLPTNLLLADYQYLAFVSYILLGLGLAFYATPSTDAALSNLPDDQAAAGAGIYKMASSLGGSFGVAISAAIFTALNANDASVQWLQGVITFVGRQDNLATREAAMIALGFNLMLVLVAILTIMLTIPRGKKSDAMPVDVKTPVLPLGKEATA